MPAVVATQVRRWQAALARPLARLSLRQRMFAAFGLLIACLLAWILWECLHPLRPALPEQIAAQASWPLSLPAVTPIPAESMRALQQRVLFKARNQIAVDTGVQATAQELLKKLQLRSVMRQGEDWVAYIQVKGEGVKRAAAGEKVGEFTVERVESRGVHLKLASEKVVLGF